MSIREVKETIVNNHEIIDEIITTLQTGKEKLTEMLETTATVTEQSESPKLEEAVGGLTHSVQAIEELITALKTAQENAQEYASLI